VEIKIIAGIDETDKFGGIEHQREGGKHLGCPYSSAEDASSHALSVGEER
jgi:hypothetical protein